MQFQKTRDAERVEIERRAAIHAAAGYPPPAHDRAMDAEAIIKAVKLARAAQPGNSET